MADIQKILSNSGPYIAKDGSLGIGIVAPDDALLHVYDTVNRAGTGNLRLTNTSNTQTVLLLENTTSRKYELAVGGSANSIGNGSFYIYDVDAGASRFEINSSGNATFTGDVTAVQHIATNIFAQNFYVASSGSNAVNRIDNDGSNLYITYGGTTTRALEIVNSNGKAIFKGNVDVVEDLKINPDYNNSNEYLFVRKHQSADGGIILESKTSGGSTQSDWQIVNHASTGDLKFYAYGLADHALTLDREDGSATFAGNVISDYNKTIALNYAAGTFGDYYKGMSGVDFGDSTARGLHLFNFDNDTNYGINFWVGTNASKTFAGRIDSTGKWGIGKVPATWKLDVDSGNIYAASFDTSNNTGVVINGNDTTASQIIGFSNSAQTYNDLDIRANSTAGSGVYIDGSTSRVGIGTTAPVSTHRVTIEADSSNGTSQLYLKRDSTDQGLYIDAGSGSAIYNSHEGTNTIYGRHIWQSTKGTDTVERMRIESSGNVGIGTTAPGRKLTVTGDASGDANNLLIANENDTDGDSASIGFSMLSNDTYVKAGIFFKRTTTQGRGDLIFATNDEVNGNNVTLSNARMTINRSGNVGIGTNSIGAGYKLQVKRDTDVNIGFGLQNSGASLEAVNDAINANIPLSLYGSKILLLNGNVGIGTTAPASIFHVASATNPVLRVEDTTNSATVAMYATDSNLWMGAISNHSLAILTNDTPAITIDTSQNATFAGDIIASGGAVHILSNQITSGWNADSEDSDIWINYRGYAGGTTRFRDFRVGDGKGNQILLIDGSAGSATFSGDLMMLSGTGGTTSKIIFKRTDNTSEATFIRTNAYWNEYGAHANEGHKFIDTSGNILLQLNGGNSTSGNGAKSATFGGSTLVIAGNTPYIKGTGTGAMRIKHTSGQTMYLRPDETGVISIFEGANSQTVYMMTVAPSTNNTQNNSAQLAFQTRSKKSDGTAQSKTAIIQHETYDIGNNYGNLNISGTNKTTFSGMDVLTTGDKISVTQADGDDLAKLYQTSADGFLELFTGQATPVSRVKISSYGDSYISAASTGRVGIGTTSPTSTLSVQGTSSNGINVIGVGTTASRVFAGLNSSNHGYLFVTGSSGQNPSLINSAGGDSYISGGNLGIGTASPSQKLHVQGGGLFTGSVSITADGQPALSVTGGISCGLDLVIAQNSQLQASRNTTTDSVAAAAVSLIDHNTGSGNRATMTMEANSYQGPKHIEFYLGTTVNGSISSGLNATGFNTSSDYRLKEDLKDFNGLEIASKIKMYDFKWKSDDNARAYGVMAHELQEILPQAVSGDKDEKNENGKAIYQGVDYSKLVPVLLKSIQELETRIKELKAQNEDLLNRVKALESK